MLVDGVSCGGGKQTVILTRRQWLTAGTFGIAAALM
jgi:hypothetical protein